MTEHTRDHENPSKNPSRPEGQDTSETMDNKDPQDPGTTEVLPAAETPPTQEIAQATQRLPEGPAPDGPAPEGEVHPAYGIAAARAQEQEGAATAVQDAPVRDDSDPLATLRDPAPEVPATPGATAPASAPAQTQPVQQARPAQAEPAQAATKRGPRVGTAVWGLIVIAVGLGILAVSAGVMFDVGVALILLLGAAGVILVVGSVVSSIRRR
ncbi:hypothetical protein ACQEVI_15740 [Promicromonospora sp. CA-289599]|uniref:hypothetical protein n=1 Tax=Promicromonospora sp. CA-289599 TaxID=3240014 RepID=UPI003D9229AC